MDFLIYVCLIIVIGAFFFLQNFSQGYNPMIIVFVLSMFGLLMVANSPPEVITGTNQTLTFDGGNNLVGSVTEFTTEEFSVFGFGTVNFFVIMFIAFLLLAVTNIYFDRIEDMNIRK